MGEVRPFPSVPDTSRPYESGILIWEEREGRAGLSAGDIQVRSTLHPALDPEVRVTVANSARWASAGQRLTPDELDQLAAVCTAAAAHRRALLRQLGEQDGNQ